MRSSTPAALTATVVALATAALGLATAPATATPPAHVRTVSAGRTVQSADASRDAVARLTPSSHARNAHADKTRSHTRLWLSRKHQVKGHAHPIRVHARVHVSNGAQPHGRVRISTAGHKVITKPLRADGQVKARLPRSVPGGHHRAHARYLPARPGRYVSSHGDPRGYRVKAGPSNRVWERLARCESGGRWHISGTYYGGLQFSLSTWHSVGGKGYPHKASKAEQIKRGKILQNRAGWGAWPHCSQVLGRH